jgi:hypothetical protein
MQIVELTYKSGIATVREEQKRPGHPKYIVGLKTEDFELPDCIKAIEEVKPGRYAIIWKNGCADPAPAVGNKFADLTPFLIKPTVLIT